MTNSIGAYFFRHCVPLFVTILVAKHIVELGENENTNDQDIDDNQVKIASTVQWTIIRPIYKVRTHVAELDHHYKYIRNCKEYWLSG